MAVKKEMTEVDCAVYKFLVDYMTENGYAPSYRELAAGVGIKSTSCIVEIIWRLQSMGKIQIKAKTPRAIKLVGYKLVKEEV